MFVFSCVPRSVPDTTVLIPSGRMQILEDGSLLIAAVRASDAGKYTCIRTNEAGSVEESAFLSVLGKLSMSLLLDLITVRSLI